MGLFNRIVDNDSLETEVQALVDLLKMKNQQGLRQLKFIINKNVEADLCTAQGFEALQAGYTVSVTQGNLVPDADDQHGWPSYAAKDLDSVVRIRRDHAKNFWVD